ncbi:MAG: hypothetical protein K6G91_13245 [Kiritimatiellae bacterium]|nr:hypothetical protein [Kiritimatiellia bacterium]
MTDETIDRLTAAINRLADALAQQTKEEKGKSPHTPLKGKEETSLSCARARARGAFVKPTVEEVAAYIKAKGYAFDAEQFWFFYDSKNWMVGRNKMKSWQSACVTWQKKEGIFASTAGRGTAAPKASNWVGSTAEQRKEFCDGLEG